MKVLRQSSRYCRGFTTAKRIVLLCLFIGLFIYTLLSISNNVCDKNLIEQFHENKVSKEYIEKLKEKWIAEQEKNSQQLIGDEPPNDNMKANSIECLINDDYTIKCLQSDSNTNDVYMPFNFIEKYFDVSGKIKHYDGYNRFEFSQSYSKVCWKEICFKDIGKTQNFVSAD